MKKVYSKSLGEMLIEQGFITQADLDKALEEQKREKKLLGEILIELGVLKEEELVQVLSTQYNSPYLPLDNYELDSQVIKEIPYKIIENYKIIPIDMIGNTLTIATPNPLEIDTQELEKITGLDVQVFVCTKSEFERALERIKQDVSSG